MAVREEFQTASVPLTMSALHPVVQVPDFVRKAPDGRPMTVSLRMQDGRWRLEASFAWYDPPEDARNEFMQLADDVAALLTLELGQPVTRQGNVSVELGDGRSMAGPWSYDLRVVVAGPSADGWVQVTELLSRQQVDPLVQDIAARYRHALDHPQSLLADAYYCLDRLQKETGSRANASVAYGIDRDVLDELGELTSTRGDSATARKTPSKPLTPNEVAWVREAVRRIALRVALGEVEPLMVLSDLPRLE